jgi:hypothetical protein
MTFQSKRQMLAVVLATNLESLGFGILEHEGLTKGLSEKVKNPNFRIEQSSLTQDLCDRIVKVVKMVDEQMGLDIALVGWSCVWKTLEVSPHLRVLTSPPHISSSMTTFSET